MTQHDLHFGKITVAALQRIECDGARGEARRLVKGQEMIVA